jgi:iron-sulfur cluster repair protein YtfE (RIC family)
VSDDPVHLLVHDHAELNLKVIKLGAALAQLGRDPGATAGPLADAIGDLREQLFLHFAREEEGLFPFASEVAPDLAEPIEAMAVAHDQICGAVARMGHLAAQNTSVAALAIVFDRFEKAYAQHAVSEAAVLGRLDERLDKGQRARLAELVRDV